MARFATENDFGFVKSAWAECFEDSREFVDWNFAYNYSAENTIVAEHNGEPVSALQLMPYKARLFGSLVPMGYVSGVATLPAYRGKGLVREMFKLSLTHMYDRGDVISILFPSVSGMYEKFGYEVIQNRFEYILNRGQGERITEFSEELLKELSVAYNQSVEGCSLAVNREKQEWDKILTDLFCLSKGYVLKSGTGYALVYPAENGRTKAGELIGDTDLDLTAVPTMPAMARIINAEALLRHSAQLLEDGVITVTDSCIPQNNFNIRIVGGRFEKCPEQGKVIRIEDLCTQIFAKSDNVRIASML